MNTGYISKKWYYNGVLIQSIPLVLFLSCTMPDDKESKTPLERKSPAETVILETDSDRERRLQKIEDKFQSTLAGLKRDLVTAQKSYNWRKVIEIFRKIGFQFKDRGFYTEALKNFEMCLNISQRYCYHTYEIRAWNDIGEVYLMQQKTVEAREIFNDNMERCAKTVNCKQEHVRALSGLGKLYYELYELKQFKEVNNLILKILNEIDYPGGYAIFLISKGRYESAYGNPENGLEYYRTALEIAVEQNHISLEATILNRIGAFFYRPNSFFSDSLDQLSLDYFLQSLNTWRRIGNARMEARVIRNLGLLYMERFIEGKIAVKLYKESLEIFREINAVKEIGQTLNNLAYMYQIDWPDGLHKDIQRSIVYMKESLEIARNLNDESDIQWRSFGLGMFYYNAGEYVNAVDSFEESLEIVENIRSRINYDDVKRKYLDAESHIDTYEYIITSLIKLGQTEEVYKYVQMVRARSFLDLLESKNNARVIRDMHNQSREHNNDIIVESSDTSLSETVDKTEPDIFAQLSANPMTINEIQSNIPSNTKIIEYFVGCGPYIFVIGQNDFSQTEYSIDTEMLHDFVTGHRDRISKPELSDSLSKELYKMLIDPVIGKITQSDNLIIIPHGQLHSLPFQSLQDSAGKYLIEKFAISYLPSASVLKYINREREYKENDFLAFANPEVPLQKPGSNPSARNNLQSFFNIFSEVVTRSIDIVTQDILYAEKEVKLISSLFSNSSVFIGAAATEHQFKASASGFRYIHLACHGELDPDQPLFSKLYLAPGEDEDGMLEVHELFSMDINADLVVLSACETARGKLHGGDDLIGLSRAFICAGTPSVIASLWKVEDKSTAFLMQRFYTYLQSGSTKAQALQKAQIDAENKYRDIYFWAPFILIGAMN